MRRRVSFPTLGINPGVNEEKGVVSNPRDKSRG
jgi:hypothetical protein